MARKVDVTVGSVFQSLTVVSALEKPPGQIYWWAPCRCVCGTELKVRTNQIERYGSCGCKSRERLTRHGLSRHPLYSVWFDMHRRCRDPARASYADYGGRGIKVCERWQTIENFVTDMGETYQPGLEIDRIDTNGNYEPDNCRWATRTEQSRNRRNVRFISHNGKVKTLTEWAKELGVSPKTVRARIELHGWDVVTAITTPLRGAKKGSKGLATPTLAQRGLGILS